MKRVKLDSAVRKALRGRSRGFILLEVVIAIALIGLIGVAVLSALSTASLALIIADKRATAESLARSEMEYVKDNSRNPYDSTDPQSYEHNFVESSDHPGYFISVLAEPLHNPDDGIQRITVVVKFRDEPLPLVSLEDYKRNPQV